MRLRFGANVMIVLEKKSVTRVLEIQMEKKMLGT